MVFTGSATQQTEGCSQEKANCREQVQEERSFRSDPHKFASNIFNKQQKSEAPTFLQKKLPDILNKYIETLIETIFTFLCLSWCILNCLCNYFLFTAHLKMKSNNLKVFKGKEMELP